MYKQILLAVDLSPGSHYLFLRTCELAKGWQSHITIIHVVEPFPYDPTDNIIGPTELELEAKRREDAQQRLTTLIEDKDPQITVNTLLLTGSIKREIIATSKQIKADLIVVGSHERHGLALLLNSTADAVLHKAPCDVLAVRVTETD